MRRVAAVVVLAVCVVAAALCWLRPRTAVTPVPLPGTADDPGRETVRLAADEPMAHATPLTRRGNGGVMATHATEQLASTGGVADAPPPASGTPVAPCWPVVGPRLHPAPTATAAPADTPAVPARIAFRALWYLGTDPAAETTWRRAIDDPAHPAGVRSDLIVDMIDEGYTDNDHPTQDDLPVILARLELIERYAPYAMDTVNAEAFEVAYRHLLDLYVRLGGAPRPRR